VRLAETAAGLLALAAAPAQVRLGSPGDPPRAALEGGAFGALPNHRQPTRETAAEIGGEYRFGDRLWFLAPFIGASGTSGPRSITVFLISPGSASPSITPRMPD
jgi:hypothetical protein